MTQFVRHEQQDNVSVFHFTDLVNIDVNSAHRVKAEIKGFLDHSARNVVISLEGIQFVDSTGFGAFISILKDLRSAGKNLVLCNVSTEVMELMDLMQLLNVFDVRKNINEAVEALNTAEK